MSFQKSLCIHVYRHRLDSFAHRLDEICRFLPALLQVWHLVASSVLFASSSCLKSVKIRLDVTWYFADLLSVVKTTCIKLVDRKSWETTCIKPVDNLQRTCYRQTGASDTNASWYLTADDVCSCANWEDGVGPVRRACRNWISLCARF